MSEKQQPYLHIVRSMPETPAEGAQKDESAKEGKEASSDVEVMPASPSVEGGACTSDQASPSAALLPANQPLEQAIMHAAVGWVALCVEREAQSVDITPIARRLYEVSVHYTSPLSDDRGAARLDHRGDDEGIMLRVKLEVASGLVVRTVVEPVRP